jgi:hypothetical protein
MELKTLCKYSFDVDVWKLAIFFMNDVDSYELSSYEEITVYLPISYFVELKFSKPVKTITSMQCSLLLHVVLTIG